jgi:hypothetical protein
MRQRSRRPGPALWTITVVAALSLLACSRSGKVRVDKVVKAPFHIKVHATGQLQSAASFYIGCPTVERMYRYTISQMAPEGKAVNEGDMLLSFDARELMQQLQLKESELDTGVKELERMQLQEQQTREDTSLQLEGEKVNRQKAVRKADYPEDLISTNESQKRKMELELADLQEKLAESRLANQISGMRSGSAEAEHREDEHPGSQAGNRRLHGRLGRQEKGRGRHKLDGREHP